VTALTALAVVVAVVLVVALLVDVVLAVVPVVVQPVVLALTLDPRMHSHPFKPNRLTIGRLSQI
jgi:hypothetical protein